LIGTSSYLESMGVHLFSPHANTLIKSMQLQGKTVVCGAISGSLVAIFGIRDPLREDSAATLHYLKEQGFEVYMLTGDNANTAATIGAQLGLTQEEIFAEVLPGDKSQKIKELQACGKAVAMVGDGINDAPALTQADLGIAIGAGTEIAIEAADIVLVKSQLADVVTAINLAKTIHRRILMNFCWAFGYNCFGVPIAAGVFLPIFHAELSPMVAGVAMALSSTSVVLSSLMLKLYRPPLDCNGKKVANYCAPWRKSHRTVIEDIATAGSINCKAQIEETVQKWQALQSNCTCTCHACALVKVDITQGLQTWSTFMGNKNDQQNDAVASEVTVLLETKNKCCCSRCGCDHHEFAAKQI